MSFSVAVVFCVRSLKSAKRQLALIACHGLKPELNTPSSFTQFLIMINCFVAFFIEFWEEARLGFFAFNRFTVSLGQGKKKPKVKKMQANLLAVINNHEV